MVAVAILVAVLASGCDASLDRAALPQTAPGSATGTPSTTVSITPVTPDGLITGPGVTDQTITLGLLVDPDRDRGFSDGVRLWQDSVNSAGGLCGRTLDLVGTGTADVPADPVQAYDADRPLCAGPDHAAAGAGIGGAELRRSPPIRSRR